MRLPERVFVRPRQKKLIAKDEPAIVHISTRTPANGLYTIRNRTFDDDVVPYLQGDWEDFDRLFHLERDSGFLGDPGDPPVIYAGAQHVGTPDGSIPKLPNITIVPNLPASESRGLARPFVLLGCTMGHYHPAESSRRIQEVYEFQSCGLMVLDHERGEIEMWVAKDGDKVAVPTGCHMTLYNLGDEDNPLITLDFADPQRNPSNKELIKRFGSVLLAYYDAFEAVFVLNRLYVDNPAHNAGVRAAASGNPREIRIPRGARLDLGRLLYEQLTRNPDIIGQFAHLGIRIRTASPEAILEPLLSGEGPRLCFSRPLADATKLGTEVYRFYFPHTRPAGPGTPQPWRKSLRTGAGTATPSPVSVTALNRPLVILVEGAGEWVQQAYRDLFRSLRDQHELVVFYADDTRWVGRRAPWAATLLDWEVYLDKADPDDSDRYRLLRPDVVFVVTPDFTHSVTARDWLGKVPTIFVEKPFDSEIRSVEELQMSASGYLETNIRGLDHYQFYALPIEDMRGDIDEFLEVALEKVEFYLTEDRPVESHRLRTLQHGLTLDLLPHLIALLAYFGDVSSIDDIVVLEASQHQSLDPQFRNETASRIRFTFLDHSGNGFRVPCIATVGKGFSQQVKYLEVTGKTGHKLRVDLSRGSGQGPGYPWGSLFFLCGSSPPSGTQVREIPDPYEDSRTLRLLTDPAAPARLIRPIQSSRYHPLLKDLLQGTSSAAAISLTLTQGKEIVRVLDRIWWAVQRSRPWQTYPLGRRSPFEPCRLERQRVPDRFPDR